MILLSVPPEIDDLKTSSDVHVNENDEALLECHANGHPKPDIKWLREDKANFTVYDRNNKRMIGKHKTHSLSTLTRDLFGKCNIVLCAKDFSIPASTTRYFRASIKCSWKKAFCSCFVKMGMR